MTDNAVTHKQLGSRGRNQLGLLGRRSVQGGPDRHRAAHGHDLRPHLAGQPAVQADPLAGPQWRELLHRQAQQVAQRAGVRSVEGGAPAAAPTRMSATTWLPQIGASAARSWPRRTTSRQIRLSVPACGSFKIEGRPWLPAGTPAGAVRLPLPAIVLFGLFFALPIGYTGYRSLHSPQVRGLGLGRGAREEVWVGLDNYAGALADPELLAGAGRVLRYGAMLGLALLFALLLDLPSVSPGYFLLDAAGWSGPDLLRGDGLFLVLTNISVWGGTGVNVVVIYTALRAFP